MSDPRNPSKQSLEELTHSTILYKGDLADIARAEIARRIAQAQIDAAIYMKWSLVAVAITATIMAMAAIGAWLWPNPLHL